MNTQLTGVSQSDRDALADWMEQASAHISGIQTLSPGDDVCSLSHVLCCTNDTQSGLFGSMDDRASVWAAAASPRVKPLTDCSWSIERVIVSFAGLFAIRNLSELPAPPDLVTKLDLSRCTGSNVSSTDLPRWDDRAHSTILDMRQSFVSFAEAPQSLDDILQSSSELHAVSATQGLMCPSYTLRSSDRTVVHIDPVQTGFHKCECRAPWEMTSIQGEQSATLRCILQPKFHPFDNTILPVPFVSAPSYDPEDLGFSLALLIVPLFIGGFIVLVCTMLSIYQHFGVSARTKTSRIPGVLTDVLGTPILARSKACDVESGTPLVTTFSAITLVVVRLDVLTLSGKRNSAWEEGLRPEFDEASERLLALLTAKKRSSGYLLSEFSANQNRCVLAFADARAAVAWALRFVKDVASLKVKPQLSTWYFMALQPQDDDCVFDPDSQLLFQGILPAIGIHTGPCTHAVQHRVRRQRIIKYAGPIATTASAVAEMAAPGQILTTFTTYCSLTGSVNQGVVKLSWLTYLFKGFASAPAGLPARLRKESSVTASASHSWASLSRASMNILGSPGASRSSPWPPADYTRLKPSSLRQSQSGIGFAAGGGLPVNSMQSSQFLNHLKHETHTKDYVVLDMGRHDLTGCQPQVTHIYQVLRQNLVYRLQMYSKYTPELSRTRALAFTQAPAAAEAIHGSPLPRMCIAFCSPTGLGEVKAVHALCAKQSLVMFNDCVTSTLWHFNGYSCKERSGIHMLAFHNVTQALEWALCFNRALLSISWPKLLDDLEATALIVEGGQVLFRGFRAAIGICVDHPSSIVLHNSNGRADYFGVHVNRAARVLAGACGGQILGPTEHIQEAVDAWNSQYGGHGSCILASATQPANLNDSAMPSSDPRHVQPSLLTQPMHHDSDLSRDRGSPHESEGCEECECLNNIDPGWKASLPGDHVEQELSQPHGHADVTAWRNETCAIERVPGQHRAPSAAVDGSMQQPNLELMSSSLPQTAGMEASDDDFAGSGMCETSPACTLSSNGDCFTAPDNGMTRRTRGAEHNRSSSTAWSRAHKADDLEVALAMMLGQPISSEAWSPTTAVLQSQSDTDSGYLSASGRITEKRSLRSHRLMFLDHQGHSQPSQQLSSRQGHPVAEGTQVFERPPALDVTEDGLQAKAKLDILQQHITSESRLDMVHAKASQYHTSVASGQLEEVLIHDGGLFAFKGVGEHVPVSSVCLAHMKREKHFFQSEESAKVQKLAEGGTLQGSTFVRLPGHNALKQASQAHRSLHTLPGVQAEFEYKFNYVDVNWT
eukprot:jgi/Ulvmu1/1495/UM011_0225.1